MMTTGLYWVKNPFDDGLGLWTIAQYEMVDDDDGYWMVLGTDESVLTAEFVKIGPRVTMPGDLDDT